MRRWLVVPQVKLVSMVLLDSIISSVFTLTAILLIYLILC